MSHFEIGFETFKKFVEEPKREDWRSRAEQLEDDDVELEKLLLEFGL